MITDNDVLKIMIELEDNGLENYFSVSAKDGKFLIITKNSDSVAVKVTTKVASASIFVQGLGEGFQFGKEWAY